MDTNDYHHRRKRDDTSTAEYTPAEEPPKSLTAAQKAKAERKYLNQLKKESNRSFSHPNRHGHKR